MHQSSTPRRRRHCETSVRAEHVDALRTKTKKDIASPLPEDERRHIGNRKSSTHRRPSRPDGPLPFQVANAGRRRKDGVSLSGHTTTKMTDERSGTRYGGTRKAAAKPGNPGSRPGTPFLDWPSRDRGLFIPHKAEWPVLLNRVSQVFELASWQRRRLLGSLSRRG
ncbi:hypothetical protein LY76DRAFT_67381 [Colletotrichum caudatum]|nr:hypothetical protein LY76DRAFT_67381 [Colletotrichum caudatum]